MKIKNLQIKLRYSLVLKVYTVNREYFVVKIFSDSLAYAKINRAKIHAQY